MPHFRVSTLKFMAKKNNNKKQARKNKVRRRSKGKSARRAAARAVAPRLPLSRVFNSVCGEKYFLAVADPFNPQATDACVPTYPARPSMKVAVRKRTTFSAPYGDGWVIISPTTSSDGILAWQTTNTYPNGQIKIDVSATGVQQINMSTIPFDDGDLTNAGDVAIPAKVQARMVSVGARIRYIGNELYRSGTMNVFVSPDHSNVDQMSFDDLLSRPETIRSATRRDWLEISTAAVSAEETNYPSTLLDTDMQKIDQCYPFSNTQAIRTDNTSTGAACMAIYVTGVNPIGTDQFEVEIIEHIEYVGKLAKSSYTPSHADAEDTSTVNEILNSSYLQRSDDGLSQKDSMLLQAMKMYREHKETIHSVGKLMASLFASSSIRRIANA